MIRLAFALLLAMVPFGAAANQLFVSPKGSDRGQCQSPKKTVRHDRPSVQRGQQWRGPRDLNPPRWWGVSEQHLVQRSLPPPEMQLILDISCALITVPPASWPIRTSLTSIIANWREAKAIDPFPDDRMPTHWTARIAESWAWKATSLPNRTMSGRSLQSP
jgi:hypothetical protein